MKNAFYFPVKHDATFGERITALRENKKIQSVQKLAEEIFKKLDKYKKTGIPDIDSATIESIRKRIASHLRENCNPKMEFIKEYCDFFQCESDFLLGYIDFPTRQNQTIYDITGLIDTSVETLKILKRKHSSILNFIMKDYFTFGTFLDNIDLYLNNTFDTPVHYDEQKQIYVESKDNISDCPFLITNGEKYIGIGKKTDYQVADEVAYETLFVPVSILESHAIHCIQKQLEIWKEAYKN